MPILDVIVGSILGPIIAIGLILLIVGLFVILGIIMLIALIIKRITDKKREEDV